MSMVPKRWKSEGSGKNWDGLGSCGDNVVIEDGVRIFYPENVFIGNNVWIGWNVTILKGVCLEDNIVVAAGSVVLSGHYPANSMLAGNPAKIIKKIGADVIVK